MGCAPSKAGGKPSGVTGTSPATNSDVEDRSASLKYGMLGRGMSASNGKSENGGHHGDGDGGGGGAGGTSNGGKPVPRSSFTAPGVLVSELDEDDGVDYNTGGSGRDRWGGGFSEGGLSSIPVHHNTKHHITLVCSLLLDLSGVVPGVYIHKVV